jgi:hypothetical protein
MISRTATQGGHSAQMLRAPVICLVLITAIYVVAIAFVNPFGDFPLNDDWSYAIAVRTLVRDHIWRPTAWTGMPLFSNALWAAPLCGITTCTHEDLRVTTLLASVILFVATFTMVWRIRKELTLPVASALLVAFNPIAFALSFTFMTDILFSALMAVTATCFIISFQQNSAALYIFGTLAAVGATLSRQLGLCIPVAYLAVQLLQAFGWRLWPIQPRNTDLTELIKGVIPLAACIVALLFYNNWLDSHDRVPALYSAESDAIVALLNGPFRIAARVAASNVVITLLYMGVFVAPILVLTAGPDPIEKRLHLLRHLPLLAALALAVCAVGFMANQQRIMPVIGNVLIRKVWDR